jgi:hypothetical protein
MRTRCDSDVIQMRRRRRTRNRRNRGNKRKKLRKVREGRGGGCCVKSKKSSVALALIQKIA